MQLDILDLFILGLHALFLLVGAVIALRRKPQNANKVPWVTGIIAVLVTWVFVAIILDGGPRGGLGSHGQWYLIFSVVTVGLVPAFTLASAAWSGVFGARALRRIFRDVTRDPLAIQP